MTGESSLLLFQKTCVKYTNKVIHYQKAANMYQEINQKIDCSWGF